MIPRLFLLIPLGVLAVLLGGPTAIASEACEPVGRLASIEGSVEIATSENGSWRPGKLDEPLCQGDTVRVGELSRAAVQLSNDAVLRLDQSTTIRLLDIAGKPEQRSVLQLLTGALKSFSRAPRRLAVNTPYVNGMIEGTEFAMRVDGNQTLTTVYEGKVSTVNRFGKLALTPGQSAVAQAGQAPKPYTLVRPQDAVQWTLYYPPIFSVAGAGADPFPKDSPPSLRQAWTMAARGDTAGALGALDRTPESQRDAQYQLYRAALLLNVGRVSDARAGIDAALARDPRAGLAHALRSVIHIVQNEREQALADAQKAVAMSRAGAAKIALSYAQQAGFQIEAARDTMLSAVSENPGDALAWARLGELWLMLGDRRQALEAARQAVSLAPDLERAQLVLGFTALTEFRNGEAKAAFERAIALGSAEPLAHLGLGLARISDGALADGRRELEAAVALGSSNSLLRAYLGKAYFEERRYPLDNQQYGIAKGLDPADPTAYLYDGILKQSVNRPIEGLRDIEESIARNDNRAVYRSRQLLDKDQASRGISLARVYNDLAFPQLGIKESAMSLATDPANAAAHRFLSDTYRLVRGQEISRVSELLQAQLLQDININPIQPSLAETNLNIFTAGGPGTAGFDEFTPLFQRNQARFYGTGFGGTQDTYGGESVIAAVYNRFSVSGGAFSYDTSGFRPNDFLRHKVYDFYSQAVVTPEVNVQAEFRQRESTSGDIVQKFDPNDFFPDLRRRFEETSARIGARLSPSPSSNVLLSFIYSDRSEDGKVTQPLTFPGFPDTFDLFSQTRTREQSYQTEAQYIFEGADFNVISGLAWANVPQDISLRSSLDGQPLPAFSTTPGINDFRGYSYANVRLPRPVTWTFGLSAQKYGEDRTLDVNRISPKVGVQWDVTDSLRLRAAFFQGVKPALASNRTIEPTQIAGFNQFFDDPNATKSSRYNIGLNWRATRDLYLGAEVTKRDFKTPIFLGDQAEFENHQDWLDRGYLYWTLTDRWALHSDVMYDKYASGKTSINFNLPRYVRTLSLPTQLTYFHPGGFFCGAGFTFVDQEVERYQLSTQAGGQSSFVLADLMVGYRFPRRLGIASVAIQNLLNKDFRYLDDNFRTWRDEAPMGPYFPARTVMAKFTINF